VVSVAWRSSLAAAVVWLGLTLAFYISYPASFFITALAFGAYLLSLLAGRMRRALVLHSA